MQHGSPENAGCHADDQTLCSQKCTDDSQPAIKAIPNPETPFL
jgi:hypothetical protein